MEKSDVLSYCIAVFNGLTDAVKRYPEVKADLLRRMDTQHDDSDGECSQEVIVSPASGEGSQNKDCTTPNSDSGFHQDSDREVTTYSSTTLSPQFHHQSAFSTYHRPDVAHRPPNNFVANPPSVCHKRSAFSPYVRPPSCHITVQDNAANEQLTVDSSQCSSIPISHHSNIWRPFWKNEPFSNSYNFYKIFISDLYFAALCYMGLGVFFRLIWQISLTKGSCTSLSKSERIASHWD